MRHWKEATIGDNERAELEALVADAESAARRKVFQLDADNHTVDCAYRARGYRCTCAVGTPGEGAAKEVDRE